MYFGYRCLILRATIISGYTMIEGTEVSSNIGAVAAGPPGAARAGAKILSEGGNAMDAAAAACMACCMLHPAATGLGGYVLAAVVLEGKTGKVWSLDANSPAPAAASESMYDILPRVDQPKGINENEYGCTVRDNANVVGPLSVAIPGQMAGMGMLWERWGRLDWDRIVEPSLEMVENGFPYDAHLAHRIRADEHIIRCYEATHNYLMPEGKLPHADDLWHMPHMSKTLRRLMSEGWRDFYDGELGREIADAVLAGGGILTRTDMASYEPRITPAYATTYRDAVISGPVLPNGCVSSMQILNMLDCFDMPSDQTVEYWHLLAEVLKLAWRDRLIYLGDPDFVDVPVDRLLSKFYAAGRVESLKQFPNDVDHRQPLIECDSRIGTLHVSTVDTEGNMVAATITQGGGFGSFFTVPDTDILLGHGMCRLDPRPGRANSVAAGKRPLNNVAPMIARLPGRDIATGMPGGRRIISAGAQLMQRMIDFGASPYEAAAAPRMHVQTHEPIEAKGLATLLLDGLISLGHEITPVESIGGTAHCADFLHGEKLARAGGNWWAAGA